MASLDGMESMVFRLAPDVDMGAYKNDLQSYNILMAMDGKHSLDTIAKENFYEIADLADKVKQLVEKGVLVPAQGQQEVRRVSQALGNVVDISFFQTLQTELTRQLGPVASLLIKDTVEKMGFVPADFPEGQCTELIDALAKFIKNEDKARAFRKSISSLV